MKIKSDEKKEKLKTKCQNSMYCFFPVHIESPKHWFLCLLRKEKDDDFFLFFFDSCPTIRASETMKTELEALFKEIFGIKKDKFSKRVIIPRQTNGDDCGIYMLRCITSIIEYTSTMNGTQTINQDNLTTLEAWLAVRLKEVSIKGFRSNLYELCDGIISDHNLDIKYRGMRNNGNCCWIIATLQCLFTDHTWLQKIQDELITNNKVEKVWESLLSIYSKTIVIRQLQETEKPRINGDWEPLSQEYILSFISQMVDSYPEERIRVLLETSKKNQVGEQCCGEFMSLLLDESKYCSGAMFTIKHSLHCKDCHLQYQEEVRKKEAIHYCYLLGIDETITMQDLLDKSLREETITNRCKRCYYLEQNIDPTQEDMMTVVKDELIPWREHQRGKTVFNNYPSTFMISIPRASCIKEGEEYMTVKLNTKVDIFQNGGRIQLGSCTYTLQAIVYHKGEEATHGHFWCESRRATFISNSHSERQYRWHEFNDGVVKVLGDDHLHKCAKTKAMWNKRTPECTLLMYKKEEEK